MHLDPYERLRLGELTLAGWRKSYAPGGDVFYIPVLKAAQQGVWRDGTLLSVVDFVITAQFDDCTMPSRLGTLWPDRMVECLAERLARDDAGRPRFRYCKRVRRPRARPRGLCRRLALLQRGGSRRASGVSRRLG